MQFLCADHDSTSEPFLELKCLMLNLSQEFKKKKKKWIHVMCRLCAWKVCLQIPFRDFWIKWDC